MLELIVQQTNSTVTTTVIQQAGGLSFLGIPLTDWITASTAVVIAIFTVVTVWEGRRNRRKDSIEKQLEQLYNPMFEIMDEALMNQDQQGKADKTFSINDSNCEKLDDVFLNYGQYLNPSLHDRVKELLRSPKDRGYDRKYPAEKFVFCYIAIEVARGNLLSELYDLEKRYRRHQWTTQYPAIRKMLESRGYMRKPP